ncbi:MAG TPA: alpha/beta hydrolase [Candidatus Binatia bacterium]|nr:alpha/beta hydrolase [Candidatus Binatia bacterium]
MTKPVSSFAATPLERRIVVAPGVALHVEQRIGARGAAPFVLVHGLASNARLWDGVAEHLHAAGHTAIAIDQRGHGRSDAPEAGYDLDTAIADLLALIGALELERPVLVGQSWGGTVVLELAWRRPDAVRGIACVDGGVVDLAQSYPVWEDCLAKLTPPALDHLTLAELESRIRKGVPHFPDRAIAAYLHCFRTRADGTVEARLARSRHLTILRSLWEHRPSTRWASLKTPTLLLLADAGDAARTTAKRRAEAVALAAGGKLRSTWFSPGHHDLHLEFPERVGDLLAGAVREGFFA